MQLVVIIVILQGINFVTYTALFKSIAATVTTAAKQAAMEDAGIEIADTPSDMADALIRAMKR